MAILFYNEKLDLNTFVQFFRITREQGKTCNKMSYNKEV